MNRLVDLRLHDGLRQRHLDLLQQQFERIVTDGLGLVDALDPFDLLGEVGLQLLDGVEFACQLREFVIRLGQLALLDRLDGDRHLRFPAGVLTGDELGGERLRLTLGQADDRLVEAVDQLAGADLVRQTVGRGFREILAVDGGRQVDGDEVALLSRALHTLEGAEAGAQRLQLGVDVGVVDLDGVDGDLQLTEVGQLDVGAHVHLGGEHQLLAVLDLGDLDVGLAQRAHLGGGDGLAVAAGQRVVDDLLEHRAAAQPRLEKLRRRFARPEPGQPHILGQLLVGTVEIGLQFRERHLHVDANPGGAQLLDGALHCGTPRSVVGRSDLVRACRGDRI